jgi:hypothetical protein
MAFCLQSRGQPGGAVGNEAPRTQFFWPYRLTSHRSTFRLLLVLSIRKNAA